VFSDIAIFCTNTALYCYSGAVADYNRVVVYKASMGAVHAWSEGLRNPRFYDCIFTGCSDRCINMLGSINPEHYNCYFNASNYLLFGAVINSALFKDCYIGAGGDTPSGATFAQSWLITSQDSGIGTATFQDCYWAPGKTVIYDNASGFRAGAELLKVVVSNKDVDPAVQEIYTPVGDFFRDNSTFKTGSASLRCEPKSASIAVSTTWQVFAPTGMPVVVSGYVRKNTSYGSSNRPYITLSGLGIAVSTYTMTDVNDTWEQFLIGGTQTTGTDGILTVTAYFQSGTAGAQAWIDGIVAPPAEAVNSGDFGFWANGQPVQLIAANYVSAMDIWNALTANLTLAGSIGKQLVDDSAVIANIDTNTDTLETSAAAIKAKTDNLPADPADASDIAASFDTVASTLATIASYIDTEVAAIKAKTDSLTFTKAGEVDVNVQSVNDIEVIGTGTLGDEWGPVP